MRSYGLFLRRGHDSKEIVPPLADPDTAKPFHVCIDGKGYMLVSCLVWASSEDEAIERIMIAARAALKSHRGASHDFGSGRAKRICEWEENGCKLKIEPFDITRIACEVNWATNGGLVY